MSTKVHEIMKIILENDVSSLNEIIDEFRLDEKSRKRALDQSFLLTTRMMLGFASATSYRGECSSELAEVLIQRTAKVINIFNFINLAIIAAGIKPEEYDFDDVPERIRQIINKAWTDKNIVVAIQTMERHEFLTFLLFLASDDVSALNVEYNLPIIERIRKENLLPDNLFLAYMADAHIC